MLCMRCGHVCVNEWTFDYLPQACTPPSSVMIPSPEPQMFCHLGSCYLQHWATVRNELEYRNAGELRFSNSGDYGGLIYVPVYLYQQRIGLPIFIHCSAVWNALVICNVDNSVNSSDEFSTSCRNLLSFRPVAPECTRFNCVLQGSISTRDRFSTNI